MECRAISGILVGKGVYTRGVLQIFEILGIFLGDILFYRDFCDVSRRFLKFLGFFKRL